MKCARCVLRVVAVLLGIVLRFLAECESLDE